MTHPKFCQIAVTHDPTSGDSVYALTSDGEVYIFIGTDGWEILDEFTKSAEEEDGD